MPYPSAILLAFVIAAGAGLPQFTDITADSGIPSLKYSEGVNMSDLDGDGLPELYLPCVKGRDRLFHNNGGLKFTDITDKTGIDVSGGIGSTIADLDGDGVKDLYVVRGAYPYGENVLYKGGDGMRFEDVTGSAYPEARRNGISPTPADFDLDGDIDVFVSNWGTDTLYENGSTKGDVRLKDAAGNFGIDGDNRSWSAIFSDFDGDTVPDLFVCRGGPGTDDRSALYLNTGGKFADETTASGLSGVSSMGAVSADFDADGDFDLFIACFEGPDRLFINDGNGRFADKTAASGIRSSRSVGAAAGCVDADPLPDIVAGGFGSHVKLFRNLGGGRFADVTAESGLGGGKKNEGVALGDLDGDGDLDLYVTNYDGRNRLYRNNLDDKRFIRVIPAGPEREFFNVRASLFRDGKLVSAQEYQGGYGFCSQSPAEIIFRLVDDGPYDIVLTYPRGASVKYTGIRAGVLRTERPGTAALLDSPAVKPAGLVSRSVK